MAVSGRKGSGFHGSLSLSSAEDFDHTCDPCLTIDQHLEAHGYCVDCQEYLCKNCFSYHKRTRASRDHQLLDKDSMNKHPPPIKQEEVCTEKCTEHKNELIKFFCREHEALGCNDCIILHHRSCTIDYIPEKCVGIGDSDEYRHVIGELGQRLKEVDHVMKLATEREKRIESCYDTLIKEIAKFRKEINDRLDQFEKMMQADADKKKSSDKQIVQNVLKACVGVSCDFNQLQSDLQENKNSKQNGQLYINIKKAKSKLKSKEVEAATESLEKTNMQYKFERNQEIERALSKTDMLGQLKLTACFTLPMKKRVIKKLTHKEDINVRTKLDISVSVITGCAVLSSGRLVLADYNNDKLKVVDTSRKTVVEEKLLDTRPFDIAVLPDDHIAVTQPDKREVLILTSAGSLTTLRTIPVGGCCNGICYHHDRLYVVSVYPSQVHIFDVLGNVTSTISLTDKIFNYPYYMYIAYSEESRLIYLSTGERRTESVVGITLQGDISVVYKHKDLECPEGILLLDDGSILVCCCREQGNIHHISRDMKQGQTILAAIQYPHSICFSKNQEDIYIGCYADTAKVLSLQ